MDTTSKRPTNDGNRFLDELYDATTKAWRYSLGLRPERQIVLAKSKAVMAFRTFASDYRRVLRPSPSLAEKSSSGDHVSNRICFVAPKRTQGASASVNAKTKTDKNAMCSIVN
jgi:hypothetical protein